MDRELKHMREPNTLRGQEEKAMFDKLVCLRGMLSAMDPDNVYETRTVYLDMDADIKWTTITAKTQSGKDHFQILTPRQWDYISSLKSPRELFSIADELYCCVRHLLNGEYTLSIPEIKNALEHDWIKTELSQGPRKNLLHITATCRNIPMDLRFIDKPKDNSEIDITTVAKKIEFSLYHVGAASYQKNANLYEYIKDYERVFEEEMNELERIKDKLNNFKLKDKLNNYDVPPIEDLGNERQ